VNDEAGGSLFLRRTAVMSVGTALSRLTGFLRVLAAAYALGVSASRLADAYNVANSTPNVVYDLVLGGVLSAVFVPVFVEAFEKRGQEAAWEAARSVMAMTLVVLAVVAAAGILAAGLIIHAYSGTAHGRSLPSYRSVATFFLMWFMPQVVFYGLGTVATGILNARRRFAAPMFAPVLNNLIVVATMIGFTLLPGPTHPTQANITTAQRYLLALGTTLGVVAMTVVLWPSLRRAGFRWRGKVNWHDPAFRRIGRLGGWVFMYVAVNQLSYLVVIRLANRIQGGFTAFTYAYIFFQLPHAIFAVSAFTALLPAMSSAWQGRDFDSFRSAVSRGLRATVAIIVPATLGYIALARPIVRLLLQKGLTNGGDAALISNVLVYFAAGLIGFSGFQFVLRAFYAMQDTRTPALVNLGATALNVVLNVLLIGPLGVPGLAVGQWAALNRRVGGIDLRPVGTTFVRAGMAGVVAAAAAFAVSRWLGHTLGTVQVGDQLVQVVAGLAAGVGVFLAAAFLLRMEELLAVVRLIKRGPGTRSPG